MPYKIVQTIERGKKFLSCVPNAWEVNNELFWPRKGSKKLQKNEESQPMDDWISSRCTVKRHNLTYEEAQAELSVMQNMSDTEDGAVPECSNRRGRRTNELININLNELAVQCLLGENNASPRPEQVEIIVPQQEEDQAATATSSTSFVIDEHAQQEDTSQEEPTLFWLSEKDSFEASVLKRFENIESSHDSILRKLAELGALIEGFLHQVQQNKKIMEIGFEPIDNIEALQDLDDLLRNTDTANSLKAKLSYVCGSGKGRGANNCYSLSDVLFTRRFLNDCSWAGGSRNEIKKHCFKSYNRVITFFFEIIYDSDKSFTMIECELFFKNILKNSVRRLSAKLLRTSAPRARVKGKGKGKKSKPVPAAAQTTPAAVNSTPQETSANQTENPTVNPNTETATTPSMNMNDSRRVE